MKKSKQKTNPIVNVPFKIDDNLYQYEIYLWYGDRMSFVEWARKTFDLSTNDVNTILGIQCVGQSIPLRPHTSLIYLDNRMGLANFNTFITLAHECEHVTFHIARQRGLTYSVDSEEAFTYHTSWLLSEVGIRLGLKNANT